MTKKNVILAAAAALFAVSGLTALPSGNITGGVGCIWWQSFRYNQNESSRRDVQ